jgi:hypothetical protein
VRSIGGGFGMTKKGKNTLKTETPVPEGQEFAFYNMVGHPTDFSAKNLREFYEILKKVDVASLEFHLYRGDFENWLRDVLRSPEFAGDCARIKDRNANGEDLREELVGAAEERFGTDVLLQE